MECVNQLYARKTYGDFIKFFFKDYKTQYTEEILLDGYGYQKEMHGLYKVLDTANVTSDTVVDRFKGVLMGIDYSSIKDMLKHTVESNGIKFDNWDNILKNLHKKNISKYLRV